MLTLTSPRWVGRLQGRSAHIPGLQIMNEVAKANSLLVQRMTDFSTNFATLAKELVAMGKPKKLIVSEPYVVGLVASTIVRKF